MASFNALLQKTSRRTGKTPACSDGKVTFGCEDGRARPVEVSPKVADCGPMAAMLAACLVPLAFTTKLQSEDKTSVSLSRTYKDEAGFELAETFAREVSDEWPEGMTRERAQSVVELIKAGSTYAEALDSTEPTEPAPPAGEPTGDTGTDTVPAGTEEDAPAK